MKGKLFIIQWDEPSAEKRAEKMRFDNWEVFVESVDGDRAYRQIKEILPNIVLIDLSKKPSHGREVALCLSETKATRSIPIIFVNGDDEDIDDIKLKVPDAVFTTEMQLQITLDVIMKKLERKRC